MAAPLLQVLMHANDMTMDEAKVLISEMVERIEQGKDPESVLYDEGLEPDYVFDLLDFLSVSNG